MQGAKCALCFLYNFNAYKVLGKIKTVLRSGQIKIHPKIQSISNALFNS